MVRAPIPGEEAWGLVAPLLPPQEPATLDAIWAEPGDVRALGAWVDRLLSSAGTPTGTASAYVYGDRDMVRYVVEVAGDAVLSESNARAAAHVRRIASALITVTAEGAHALADAWAPGLTLGLALPGEEPRVVVVRGPRGDLVVAMSGAAGANARRLVEELPAARSGRPVADASLATESDWTTPSGGMVVAALAAASLAAVGIAAWHASGGASSGSTPAIAGAAPPVAIGLRGPIRPPRALEQIERPPVASGVIAADPRTGDLALVGCCDPTQRPGATPSVSTWTWDGRHWTHVLPTGGVSPTFQTGRHLAFDSATGSFLLQGGKEASDTWSWDGAGGWSHLQPAHEPPPGIGSMVYDGAARRAVLVVPDADTQLLQTWGWDGGDWTLIGYGGPTLFNPQAALVFDHANKQLVLLAQSGYGSDVVPWTLGATTWTGTAPIPAMLYDPSMQAVWDGVSNRVIVVELGPDAVPANGSTIPADTWAWDGTAWSHVADPRAPNEKGVLVTTAADRVVFVGVDEPSGVPDVWAWTGTNWTPGGGGVGGFGGSHSVAR